MKIELLLISIVLQTYRELYSIRPVVSKLAQNSSCHGGEIDHADHVAKCFVEWLSRGGRTAMACNSLLFLHGPQWLAPCRQQHPTKVMQWIVNDIIVATDRAVTPVDFIRLQSPFDCAPEDTTSITTFAVLVAHWNWTHGNVTERY